MDSVNTFIHDRVKEWSIGRRLRTLYMQECVVSFFPYSHRFRVANHTQRDLTKIDETLTYRKINDWQARGLIFPNRSGSKRSWRRFSVPDIVELLLVQEMKSFGISSSKIRLTLQRLTCRENPDLRKLGSFLEVYFILTLLRLHFGILIYPNGTFKVGLSSVILEEQFALQRGTSFLYISFSDIVNKIQTRLGKRPIEFLPREIGLLVQPQHIELLRILENRDFEELRFYKSLDGHPVVKILRREQGKFPDKEIVEYVHAGDFSRVEIFRKNGEAVTVIVEDVVRL